MRAERPGSADDAWLDEALAESFPASDPVPWRHSDARSVEQPQRQEPATDDAATG